MEKVVHILLGSTILAITLTAAAVPVQPTQVLNGTPDAPLCLPGDPVPDISIL